jgi:hypothetical protein
MKKYILLFINVVTRFFTGIAFSYALLSVLSINLNHQAIDFTAVRLLKIFVTAAVIGAITVFRIGLENKKWMLRLSLIQKRWIFMPLYLITILLFIYDYGLLASFGIKEIVLCSSFFFVIAGISTAVVKRKYEAEKKSLTDSVSKYKTEIGGN